jgi:hypothetical protein
MLILIGLLFILPTLGAQTGVDVNILPANHNCNFSGSKHAVLVARTPAIIVSRRQHPAVSFSFRQEAQRHPPVGHRSPPPARAFAKRGMAGAYKFWIT